MADHGAFVLPAGVQLKLQGDALCIESAGDIFIEGAAGVRFHRVISSAGDIVFRPEEAVSLHTIRAPQGRVTVSGRLAVESIHARDLSFRSGTLRASVIKASGTVSLSGERLEANVVVGNKVQIAPGLAGRATAIHSIEEMGAHRLKGGFSLAEFVALVPDGAALLTAHDITVPLGGIRVAQKQAAPEDAPAEPSAVTDKVSPPTSEPAATAEAIAARITHAMHEIRGEYGGGEVPAPIDQLGQLVDQADFPGVADHMHRIWSNLLKHHQKAGQPISNAVSHSFQSIQLALRELEG